MALKTQQGIVIYSPAILGGEKFQGLIKQITPDHITIIIPINNISIDAGIDLFVNFWDNKATYEFESKSLTSKGPTENIMNIARPVTLQRVINRSFPRIVIKVAGRIFDHDGFHPKQCLIYDISGGGALITAMVNNKVGDLIKISFVLPGGEQFEQVGASITWKKHGKDNLLNYGIEFDKLSEIRRQKIIAFINSRIAAGKKE